VKWVVEILRTERIEFVVEADSAVGAANRYLTDGDETASRTESIEVVDVTAVDEQEYEPVVQGS